MSVHLATIRDKVHLNVEAATYDCIVIPDMYVRVFIMNLEQCIVKKMFKMETCGTTSEEVLRLGNDKGKIPLLFKLFLE